MRLWPRGGHAPGSQAPRSKARRAGRVALVATPVLGITVLALAASGVLGTLAQGTASINNTNNNVVTKKGGLLESQDGTHCPAAGNGQWNDCDINKFGGGSLTSNASTGVQTVTLQNTGNTDARLFLLPSACTDSLTGANGALCAVVSATVSCSNGSSIVQPPGNLNTFFAGRNPAPNPPAVPPPSGYPMGTIAAGASITCTFQLTAGTIPNPGGTISQPLAWKLVA